MTPQREYDLAEDPQFSDEDPESDADGDTSECPTCHFVDCRCGGDY